MRLRSIEWTAPRMLAGGLLAFWALGASAFWAPSGPELPNFDRRSVGADGTAAVERATAVGNLRALVPNLQIHFDERLGTPRWIIAERGFLTGPGGTGNAIRPQTIASFPPNEDYLPAKGFLREHQPLFGFGPEILATARTSQDSITAHNGMRTVIWEQQLDGITVFEGLLISHTTKNDELVSLSSQFIPNLSLAADAGTPNRGAVEQNPPIAAADAIRVVVSNLGETVAPAEISPVEPESAGPERRQHFTAAPLNGQPEAKLVWLPMNPRSMRLCWQIVLTSRARGEMYQVLVDAMTGEALVRHRLTEYLSPVSYRVYTSDSPSPFSPGCPTPCVTQPALIPRNLVTWSALDTNASPSGWIDDGGNETRGNNVDAHTDRDANDSPDLPRPQGSPFRTFDFALDLLQEPVTYTNAAVVDLFYWNNWMHDKLYALGFTEAARNFQSNNFGRGGLGNDAVQADAQDGSGVNNANFSTPSDGSPGRMQMYLFSGPTPDRDGDLDHEVVLHEYTHGLSNRRVGGGVGISAVQPRGMGEGWSDWYALSLLSEAGDDVNGVYAAGGYATYQLSGMISNYYFGIRRYPYCTDMTKNPLTFKDIDPNQASLHPGIPRSPIIGSTADEVHNQGEVWCVTLWEARANLITKYGYATGNQLILQLVTDGMNLSPANPNFLQARDAILQADVVDNGGADLADLWMAFAKRGMGSGATSPASSTTIGLVESYTVPDSLTVSPGTGFTGSGPVGGPFSPASQVFTLLNTGTNAINWTGSQTSTWMNLSLTAGTIAVGSTNTVTASLSSGAYALAAGIYNNTVRFTNTTTGVVNSRNFVLRVGQPDYFTELFDGGDNDVHNETLTFTPDGSTNFYSVCREPAVAYPTDPTGGINLALGAHTFMQLITPSNISIYGRSTNVIYLASEGHLTLNTGDSSGSITLANHFSRPRVSASLVHIHPTENGGIVSWLQLSNRIAITFNRVVEYATANTNSFQIELFYDGRIRMTHLAIASTGGLVGLSAGNGVPLNFLESDLDTYGPCALPMTLTLPHNATEGDAAILAQINIFSAATTNVTFTLSSSDSTQATVPASVTLLAGQTVTNFSVGIVDDTLLDGPQAVTISASAPGFALGADTVLIADNETAALSVVLPAAVTEGGGSVQGTVRSSAAPSANINVALSSSDVTEIQVPASVILPAGQTSVVFTATIVDDTQIDGDQSAIITAHVPNWTDAQATVVVHDNEPTNLVVTLPVSAREGDGVLVNAGTVRISGALPADLTVSLLSSDTTELTVPPAMTIIAGQTSGTFSPTVVDDTIIDGPQTVTITASAAGFSNGSTNMIVNDDESPPLPVNPTPAHLATNVVQTTGLAWSSGAVPGEVITNDVYIGTTPTPGPAQYQGTTLGTNWTLPNLLPLTTYYWQIVAKKTGVVPGPVWQFTTRGVDHFAWNPVASPQYVSQPFTATVAAKDIFETTVSNFTGQVTLSGNTTGGSGTNGAMLVVETSSTISGTVRPILNNLGKTYDFVSTATLSSLNFSNYSTVILGMSGGAIDYPGMTSLGNAVKAGANLIILGGSSWLAYATGLNDYLIGVNTNNYTWQTVSGSPHFSVTAPGHPLVAGLPLTYNFLNSSATYYMARVTDGSATSVASNGDGFPSLITKQVGKGSVVMFINVAGDTYWNNTADLNVLATVISNSLNWVQSHGGASIPITPAVSGAFNNGVWTGGVTVLAPATNVVLRADDGNGHSGSSAGFAVLLQNDISLSIADAPDPVSLGGSLTYSLMVTNIGPSAANGVVVTNLLPSTANLVSVTPSQGTFTSNSTQVVCNLGSIPGNGSATITIGVIPMSVGIVTNQASVSRAEADAYPANNTVTAVTVVQTPVISINNVTLYEGNSGSTNAVFTVSVSPPPALPVTVNYATANGTAIAPGDFIATNGVLNFAAGQTNKSIIVTVLGDTLYELNETFNLNLSSPSNAVFANSVGLGMILNDDPIPTISIGDVTLLEGNVGTTNAVFPVTLSAAAGIDVTVSYATANGNATAGSDYVARSGSLIIPAGLASTNISISVNGDLLIEPDEVFYVDLSFPANATLLKREGYALIQNDDGLAGQLDHFAWTVPATMQYLGIPFGVTITALDSFNNPASAFNGTANLSGFGGGGQTTNTILGNLVYSSSSSGSYTLGYSFTPNTNITVTHVRSYSGSKVSIWTDTGTLLASQNVAGASGVWTQTALPTPLSLTAGVTYRVAFYTGGGSYYWRTDGISTFPNGVINIGWETSGDGFPSSTDSVRWWFVDLVYNIGSSVAVPISPTVTGPFVSGSWNGNLTALATSTNLVLRADDGNGHTGFSTPPIVVSLQNDISIQMTDSPDPASVGAAVTYAITVSNTGPASATSVMVTNALPPGASFISASGSQGTIITNSPTIVYLLGSLPANASATASVVVASSAPGPMTNQATVYRGEPDAFTGNNSATAVTAVQLPVFSINSVSVTEGNSGFTPAVFTVSLSVPPATNASVNFATADGAAQAGSDYVATNGILNFAPGQTSTTITVQVIGDTTPEPNETFSVVLSSPINAALGASVGTGTIISDEFNNPTNVLAQGNLRLTLNLSSAGLTSVAFQSNEIYQVGTYISDWGLQTGTNGATFVRNANGSSAGVPMTWVFGDARSASFTGTYTSGGANVAVTRDYALLPGSDLWRTTMTFRNNGGSAITLRFFETFDVDWIVGGISYFTTANDRYTIVTNGTSILIGRSLMTNGPLVVMLGAVDPGAVVAAVSPTYFGITTFSDLNTFFATNGWDSQGLLRDATLDIGKEIIIAPSSSATFASYQSISTNIPTAEWALVSNLARAPLRFAAPKAIAGGSLQLALNTTDGSPITPERAGRIQFYSTTNVALPFSNWTLMTNQSVINNGALQINTLTYTNAPLRFFRAVEPP